MELQAYSDHFVIFADLLGFEDALNHDDSDLRLRVLDLLSNLAARRSEFSIAVIRRDADSTAYTISPAISTFSDHIVISYHLGRLHGATNMAPNVVLFDARNLLGAIAAQALRLGFLIRGGATIGKLHHEKDVVFGDALVEAFKLESRLAIYPRVVLSPQITHREEWRHYKQLISEDEDGILRLEYFGDMLSHGAVPGPSYFEDVGAWFDDVVKTMDKNLAQLRMGCKLKALAKWVWFVRKFRAQLSMVGEEFLRRCNIDVGKLPRP